MKHQAENRFLFKSEDILIIMHEDLHPEGPHRTSIIESKSGFNLLFLLSPNISMKAYDCDTQFTFRKNQYILHYSQHESTADLWTENFDMLKFFQVQISYQYVFNLINPESNKESGEILENMTRNNFIFLHNETPPTITVEMHMILREIISYSRKGIMQKLFIEAKIIKLLILIFEQFNEEKASESEAKTPEIIKKYVDENYHKNLKIEDIGKSIGINLNKIRKEFKAQYHITVSDYMAELRMLKAKKMIADKDIMIKEIAIECGYEYVQNFTRAFKKKFGVSPEKLRAG